MITFRRILFPVDFSSRNRAAVPLVRAMARRFDAELTILHVLNLPPAGIAEAAAWITLRGSDRLRQQGKIALDSFVARELPDMRVRAEFAEGDPATIIVEYARDRGADLIMLPTTGVGPFRRLLLGSVTAKVLHDTGVPVWTGVHADDNVVHPSDRWKRLLCALDDDQCDLPILQWAAQFAIEQNLELQLVHAVRGPEECEENSSLRKFLFDVAGERMEQLQAQAGTKLEACLKLGKVGRVVHQAALGYSADLVVIGRGAIQKSFGRLRSGAYEIIRETPCPVISL